MAYDENLAQRIRGLLKKDSAITERKMFGGIAFLRKGYMFVGVLNSSLMARIGKEHHAEALGRKHVRQMDFTGKPMQGYVFVDADGIRSDAELQYWIERSKRFVSVLPAKESK